MLTLFSIYLMLLIKNKGRERLQCIYYLFYPTGIKEHYFDYPEKSIDNLSSLDFILRDNLKLLAENTILFGEADIVFVDIFIDEGYFICLTQMSITFEIRY